MVRHPHVSAIYIGRLHLEGVANLLSGLTNHVINHLLTGMILQVASVKLKVTASLRLKVMMVWNMKCPFSFGEKVTYVQGVFSCLVVGSVLKVLLMDEILHHLGWLKPYK